MKQAAVRIFLFAVAALGVLPIAHAAPAQLEQDAQAALSALYQRSPAAKALGAKAKAILVFPSIRKAGLLIGAQSGEGVMLRNGAVAGHYRVDGVLVGLEAGAQSFAYAMFFTTDAALEKMREGKGLELGADPNIVIDNDGRASQLTTSTLQADVYGYVFNQKGLMGGVALEGLKITQVGG